MYCVVIGDMIKSKAIEAEKREIILKSVKDSFDQINTTYAPFIMASFGMVRGDAFEGVLFTPYQAPVIIQELIKAFHRAEHTPIRISVVIGRLTTVGTDRNETDGPAFYDALRRLDILKKNNSDHWLQVSFDSGTSAQPLIDSQFALLTALTEGWTDKQREIAWEMEARSMQTKAVANALGITQSVVRKQLKAACYEAYRDAWAGLEKFLLNMDEEVVTKKGAPEATYLAYYNVAVHSYYQYDYAKALTLMKKSLELAIAELGDEDQQLIPIYNHLSDIYQRLELLDESEKAINKSLELQKDLPKARELYAFTLNNKASLCSAEEKFDEAVHCMQEALDIILSLYGPEHIQSGTYYNDFSIIYDRMGNYTKAIEMGQKAVNIYFKHKNISPVSYAIIIYNLSKLYVQSSRYDEAKLLLDEALQIYENNLPSTHEYITSCHNLLNEIKTPQGS